jgi:predicted HicB family RNase H-like nuclease
LGDAPPALGGRRLSRNLHQRAALYAEEHDLKLNAVVQLALKEYLTHAE